MKTKAISSPLVARYFVILPGSLLIQTGKAYSTYASVKAASRFVPGSVVTNRSWLVRSGMGTELAARLVGVEIEQMEVVP